ncbi:hypothetical protein [Cellulomonas citrea]|uniref:hypothetical protein n=1 Tax=Cellulomonas citrea TaxID=1909423 RepID=UPI0013589BD9|nr:hypothetical protein [Cellulomonas citrea]MBQ1541477.1 hypothetical protein [Caulobacteraceae bacterium]
MKNFLALYMGSPNMAAAIPDLSDETKSAGIAAWGAWMRQHADAVVETGGPLGRTKKISPAGVADFRNAVTGYVVVRAETIDAAAAMFVDHPHFAIFPGDSVEVVEQLPIPAG